MEFKQKAEEKKMSMSKNIARLAVTAGLTAALSFGGVMAPVTMAFAEGTPTVAQSGNVTITESTYKDTTFKGIQIFKATVTQDMKDNAWNGDKTLSDIEWAGGENGSVKSAVIHAFDKVAADSKPTDLPTENSAQAWAKFINNHASEVVDNNVNAGTVLDMIARALEGANIAEGQNGWQTSNNGAFNTLKTGYWLFVTKSVKTDSTNQNTDAFTSPIFTIVGGADVTVEPKKDVPNVTKAVKDDAADGTFGTDVFAKPNMSADSRMDQFIEYQLAGKVASNINSYSTYMYSFTDSLPDSMTVECGEGNSPVVAVKIDGNSVKADPTSGYTASYSGNKLTVSFADLKSCVDEKGKKISVSGSSIVTVEYKAKLDPDKIFEGGKIKEGFQGLVGKAQTNTVQLTYSNNPHNADGTGSTVTHPAYDYTYGIDVTKVGSDTDETGKHKTLEGVQFTLQEKDSSEFIKADGTTTSTKDDAILTTDSNGKINVVGLDEGIYTLTEVTPAPGYNNSAASGVTFTIASDSLPTNGDSFTPSCTLAKGTDGNLVQASNATDGKVHLIVTDQKGSGLPLTGLNGVTFTWIAGGAVLCIGVAHLIRSRKQAEESEQE